MIPPFQPPSADFGSVRTFQELRDRALSWIGRYVQYTNDYFQVNLLPPLNADFYNFGPDIAAASTINPQNYVQRVTGTAAISTINAPIGFSGSLVLYALNGFSITTGGNITPAATIPAGQGALLTYDAALSLWVAITSGSGGGSVVNNISQLTVLTLPFADSPYTASFPTEFAVVTLPFVDSPYTWAP